MSNTTDPDDAFYCSNYFRDSYYRDASGPVDSWRSRLEVPCLSQARYVFVRKLYTWDTDVVVCDIEVLGAADSSWDTVHVGRLASLINRELEHVPVPYEHVLLPAPVQAQYVRFRALTFYKSGAGLANIQVTPPSCRDDDVISHTCVSL